MSPRDLLLDASDGVEPTGDEILICVSFGRDYLSRVEAELFRLVCLGAFPLDRTANPRKIHPRRELE